MSYIDKVVLITGASSGLGEAIATSFAKISATLSLIDIDGDNLKRVAEECKKLNGNKVVINIIDLHKDELIQEVVNYTVKQFNRIDVVINCAGIYRDKFAKIVDCNTMGTFDEVMAVNLRAVVRMTNCVAPVLIKTKGCIISISSAAPVMASADLYAYFVSKAALCKFMECAALELAPYGVRVNAILPGAAKTPILLNSGKSLEESDKFFELNISVAPLKKLVKPQEIADMAVYLAGDSAASITGANIIIDAGISVGISALKIDSSDPS